MARPFVLVFAPRILFESFFSKSRLHCLEKFFNVQRTGASKITPAVRRLLVDADACITCWDSPFLGAEILKLAPRLRIIVHLGGEVKHRFDASLFEKLTITNSAGPFAVPAAEFAATLLLYSARNLDAFRAAMRQSPQRIQARLHTTGKLPGAGDAGETLVGREVSLIGYGRIGRTLTEMLCGFGIHWLVYDPYAARTSPASGSIRFVSLNQALRRGSFVVLAAAATDQTRHLLNAQRLAMLPNGATIINIARGSLIDLPALTREIQSGRLRCALDVTDPEEPLPRNHPLRKLFGAILTPHIAAGGVETRGKIADIVIDDLERFFRGKPVQNRVTAAMLARMT